MRIDDREDALSAAQYLVDAKPEQIANALLEAHLEGVQMGRVCLGKLMRGTPLKDVVSELDGRYNFVHSLIAESV